MFSEHCLKSINQVTGESSGPGKLFSNITALTANITITWLRRRRRLRHGTAPLPDNNNRHQIRTQVPTRFQLSRLPRQKSNSVCENPPTSQIPLLATKTTHARPIVILRSRPEPGVNILRKLPPQNCGSCYHVAPSCGLTVTSTPSMRTSYGPGNRSLIADTSTVNGGTFEACNSPDQASRPPAMLRTFVKPYATK